jgi:hypothetical protein
LLCWQGKLGELWWTQTLYVLDFWWPSSAQKVKLWKLRTRGYYMVSGWWRIDQNLGRPMN